jgi:2,3-bisphosphoglycerate-dependent phosphoglycerate mutase
MELLLIRHGLPEHVATDDGSPADPPLSATGHLQASQVADWLERHHIDALYSSPMQRALQTAAPLSSAKGLDIQVRDGVAEYDRHAGEYIPVEKLKEQDYERWKLLMKSEFSDVDFKLFYDEVVDTIEAIITANGGKTVAITCHGGVINAWTAHILGLGPKMFFNPNYTSINRYMAASSGERSIVTLNQHVHLD